VAENFGLVIVIRIKRKRKRKRKRNVYNAFARAANEFVLITDSISPHDGEIFHLQLTSITPTL